MTSNRRPQRLTSLLLVEEKLLEAEFFMRRFRRASPDTANYFLNAYLSAARSVTFLLQKELAYVPGFPDWWNAQRTTLGADMVARFFLELRNFSQKAGRVSLTGARAGGGRSAVWTYRFVGVVTQVPGELKGVDAADACSEHLAKLARILLACIDAFPYHSCPSMALSPAGVNALGLNVGDMFRRLELPYVNVDDELALRVLREQVDPVDVAAIRKVAFPRRRRPVLDPFGARLLAGMEARLRDPSGSLDQLELAADLLDAFSGDQGRNRE